MATPSDAYGVGKAGELIAATLAKTYGVARQQQSRALEPPAGARRKSLG